MADEKPTEEAEEPKALVLPPSAELPIEALLQLPPPTPPNAEIAAQLAELASPAEPDLGAPEAAPPDVPEESDAAKLREAILGAPETIGNLSRYSPKNLAKSTVEASIDRALEMGGLRTPTRPQE